MKFILNDADFENLVEESFTKIISNEVETVKFPHTLTIKHREFIHKKTEDCSLSTKSEGTRNRVVYLFREVMAQPVQSSNEASSQQKVECPVQNVTCNIDENKHW